MLLALAACGQQPAASAPEATPEPAQAPTPVPTPTPTPEPTPIPTEAAAVLLDRVGAAARVYDLDEKVKIVGEADGYYTLSDGLLVEKWLVRLDTEEAPAERTAYAKGGDAALYGNVYCEGEPLLKLSNNQAVTVLDEFGPVLRVRAEEKQKDAEPTSVEGYLLAADTVNYNPYGYYGGGYYGGPADGGEISLTAARVGAGGYVLLADGGEGLFTGGPGKILGQGAEGYARVYKRSDEVAVMDRGEKTCAILFPDGSAAAIPTKLLFFKGDEVTEPWTAYARSSAPFYRNWRTRLDTPEKLAMNTKLEIVGTFGDYLIAQKEDKTVGLIEAAQVSETEIVNYYYGGGDGGYSGGGGGGGGPEWSEPAM